MPRYVILYHEMPVEDPRPSHWDLLLESGNTLRSWALAAIPTEDEPIAARRLADHRMAYLDYEGPVSGNRGSVRQWDIGVFQWLQEADDAFTVDLQGRQLVGQVTLAPCDERRERWVFRYRASTSGTIDG